MFEHEIISRLSDNSYIASGLSRYEDKPAIFAYYVPKRHILKLPYILFYTESYDVPTRSETKKLTIEFCNNDIEAIEFRRYSIEIINTIDNLTIENDYNKQLRFYLANNPEFKPHPLGIGNYGELIFIIRGDLKSWGIV